MSAVPHPINSPYTGANLDEPQPADAQPADARRSSDAWPSDAQRSSDARFAGGRSGDGQVPDGRPPVAQFAGGGSADGQAAAGWSADGRAAGGGSADGLAAGAWSADGRAAGGWSVEKVRSANKRVVEAFFQAVTDRNYADWPRYMALDVIDHNKVIFGEEDRPGAAFDAFRQQLEAFGEGGMYPQQLIAESDTVVARVLVRGRHTGFHPRMPEPTGRTCEVEQIWILTLRDGKIAEIRAVSDRLGMFIQLGWDWPTLD